MTIPTVPVGSIYHHTGGKRLGRGKLYLLDSLRRTRGERLRLLRLLPHEANAPKGSAYATFISRHKSDGGNETDSRKKLNYRVYLGGSTSKEFDLYDNTNYIYNVEMSHNTLPVDDRRITIIDPIPASQNNNNIVPTANCFMVKPVERSASTHTTTP